MQIICPRHPQLYVLSLPDKTLPSAPVVSREGIPAALPPEVQNKTLQQGLSWKRILQTPFLCRSSDQHMLRCAET